MGLSASSLRLAMLTARKSSLEFEGQQINQQRLSLSNQTAALFNAMLTMQVPTPPDPTEFSKMVYTFNKGDGLSTLLNVSRNSSGAFSHDVTYIGPKTDNVLMKKQLNNVGFKHENGQMSAVIDGLSYALSLNGNQEKLEEYVKTKNTYDNVKNVETQMQALNQMPQDKELSSSQMKQYFEALGLSSYNSPKQGKVDDVKTMDDAFQNLYNAGNEYSYEEVTLTYDASTSPITVNDKFEEVTTKYLSANSGSLTGDYEKGYSYTTNVLPNGENTEDKNITYSLINNGEDNWTWKLENVNKKTLEKLGITHTEVYGEYNQNGEFVEEKYTDGTNTYSNIIKNKDGTYSYDIDSNPGYDVFYKSKTLLDSFPYTTSAKYQYTVTVDGNNYLAMKEGETWYFTSEAKECKENIQNNTGKFRFLNQSTLQYYQKNYVKTGNEYVYSNSGNCSELKISYNAENDKWSLSGGVKTSLNPNTVGTTHCLYNLETGVLDTFNEEEYNENKDKDNYANCTVSWETINEEPFLYAKIEEKDITKYEKNYDGKTYTSSDKGDTYEYVDTYQGEKRQNILFKDNGKWQHQSRYTAKQLGIEVCDIRHLHSPNTTAPPEIETHTYDKYIIQQTKDKAPIIVQKGQATNIGNYSITRTGDTFTIQGDGFPCDSIKKEQETKKIYESNNGNAIINRVTYDVVHNGDCPGDNKYTITAKFKAWVTGEDNKAWSNDEEQDGYSYDETNHTLTLTTPNGAIAQILLRNQNNQRDEDCDKNITVNEMLGFYEQILKQFGLYGSSATYKTKLDKAKSDYLSTIDAKGVENPGENQALFNFIDANGKNAYIYVPLDYINKDGQVDSTYAYMYETSYLENQTETISQKANIIYDENGRIVKISFDDGTVVLPEVKTEQDEEAYNAAMVKYDYEKQVYDKELSDINAKTEVIAQQDKNLEIKLKSIDTQHSAISTEIEALNKVLQNNVKSGFNTFNA